MSGYSFQIILQHIKLKGWAGKNDSEICVPGSQQTQEWETSAPSSDRTPETVYQSHSFNHRNVGTQNPPLRHYSGGPILRHFLPLQPRSPQLQPHPSPGPRSLGPQPPPPSRTQETGLSSSSSSFQDPIIPAHVEPPSRPESCPGQGP